MIARLALTLAILLFGVSTVTAQDSENPTYPRWSPDAQWISFLQNGALWVSDAAGTTAHNLTADMPALTEPGVWSPVDNLIAFATTGEIWVTPLDGTKRWSLSEATDESAFAPKWSPDGGEIIFATDQLLWRAAVVSGEANPLTKTAELEGFERFLMNCAEWSPDGQRFVFLAQLLYGGDGGSLATHEYVIDRSGDNLIQLEADVVGCIFWGSDSDSVFIRGFDVYGGPAFYIDYNAIDGTWDTTIRLTNSWEAASMSVSPDRTRVAFHTVVSHEVPSDGPPRFEYEYPSKVVIVRAPTGERQELAIPDALLIRETMIAWSPDASALYVTATCVDQPRASALWVVPLSGDTPERLTDCFEGWLQRPVVSPDGSRIAFEADWNATPAIHVLDLTTRDLWQVVAAEGARTS